MLPPDTLLQDRYLVTRLIARGGMGAVYEAVDQRFRSPVALKQKTLSTPEADAAFEREARLLNGLRHAALPKVTDYFSDEHGQFLVMEYIPGDDLHTMLTRQQRPFLLDDVLRWSDQVLDALDYLHQQRPPVIHRDIKPQNLKLTADGQVILLDFGIAKGGMPRQTQGTEGRSVRFYTPEYAPIEQVDGSGTEPRSDLYALAATLYHLLTSTAPADALSRMSSMASGQPDPLRPAHLVNSQVPASISDVLMHALELRADARPSSAAEMRDALQAASQGTSPSPGVGTGRSFDSSFYAAPTVPVPGMRPTTPPPPSPAPESRHAPSPPSPSPAPPRPVAPPPPAPRAAIPGPLPCVWIVLGGLVAGVVLVLLMMSVMGQRGEGEVASDVTPTPTATLEATASPSPETEETPSPEMGEASPEPDQPDAAPPPQPEGRAGAGAGTIAPSTINQLTSIATWEGHWDGINQVRFSPDGNLLATATDEDLVRVWRVSDGTPILALEGHRDDVTSAVFAPDGRTLVSGSDDETVRVWLVENGSLVRTLEGHEDDVTSVAFSRDGLLIASGSNDNTVRVWRAQDGMVLDVLGIEDDVTSLDFSPDGQALAIGSNDNTVRVWRVGGVPSFQSLEGHSGDVTDVAFSPDGQVLASSSVDGTVRLWGVNGGAPLAVLRNHRDGATGVAFSPDGQVLASSANDSTVRLWRVSDGASLRVLEGFRDDATGVAFSPDGTTLAAGSDDTTVRLWQAIP